LPPRPKTCGGDALKSPPQEFCYVIFETVKCTFKIRIYRYASDKRYADFSLKMLRKRLAAGLCPDPLGELTARSPRPKDLRAGARTREGEKGKRQEGVDS